MCSISLWWTKEDYSYHPFIVSLVPTMRSIPYCLQKSRMINWDLKALCGCLCISVYQVTTEPVSPGIECTFTKLLTFCKTSNIECRFV